MYFFYFDLFFDQVVELIGGGSVIKGGLPRLLYNQTHLNHNYQDEGSVQWVESLRESLLPQKVKLKVTYENTLKDCLNDFIDF